MKNTGECDYVTIDVELDDDVYENLKRMAEQDGITIDELVSNYLEKAMESEELTAQIIEAAKEWKKENGN